MGATLTATGLGAYIAAATAVGDWPRITLGIGMMFSELPFLSSDNPVTYQFGHIDDLYRVSIPKDWIYENIGTNEQNFFCYCALTPTIAVISSPFIQLKR